MPNTYDPVLLKFIDKNWDTLASLAWHGYLKKRRGAVIFTEKDSGCKGAFFSRKELRKTDVTIYNSVKSKIDKYDPEFGFVFVYVRESGDFHWQTIHGYRYKLSEIARMKDEQVPAEHDFTSWCVGLLFWV